MTFTAISIITLILAIAAFASMFVPRIPGVLAAYAALVCAHLAGAAYVDAKILIYWGIATAIVLGLRMLQPKALVYTPQGQSYVALGTIAGVMLGYAVSPVSAALIAGGATGALLGAFVFMRTPAGPRLPLASSEFVQYLCAKGLPAIITSAMAAISIASLI